MALAKFGTAEYAIFGPAGAPVRKPPQTQDTVANKLTTTQPAAGSVEQINTQYTQYQVNLANDLTSGKINQAQYQNEFEKLRAQQAAALARVPAVSKPPISPPVIDATSTASEVTASDSATTSNNNNNKNDKPIPNPLLAYPSYTYGLSLAILTVSEYNDVVSDTKNYKANRVIIASAGRHNNDEGMTMFKRAPHFSEDFYFENLNMTTVIGMNERSRATNAIDLKFTIIEPYGVTLLDRIIDLSTDIGSVNYISQPYLLQIDFFGTNDAGEIVGIIPDQTKRIPIRMLSMNIKASNKGAEYEIVACPYNHSAWDLSTVTTPANFEITADTIDSFLSNSVERIADDSTQCTAIYKVKSYGGALTGYFEHLAIRDNSKVSDKYNFKVHPDILKNNGGLFNLNSETLSTAQTPMASEENGMSIRGGPGNLEHNVRIFAINSGTTIEQVVAFAMRHTHYLQGQIKPVSTFNGDDVAYQKYLDSVADKPLKWYKIVPTIKLGDYNIPQETWSRTITYHIIPYTIYNTKTREGPQGTWTKPWKLHNYWYTGKNNDVLDFNIEFNALYYTAVTAYREHLSKTQNLLEADIINAKIDAKSREANAIMLAGKKSIIINSQQHPTGGEMTIESIALADVESSLYTTAGGDMLQAKLKIIGDPQYIKQDEVFYPPSMTTILEQVDGTGNDPRLIANGSLNMDQGEVYVQVTVKSPSDIDESTGMMKFDSKHSTSLFSGMYRILTVESTFSGGKFEQTLDVVRLPRQTSLEPLYAVKDDKGNRETTAATPLLNNVDAASNIGPDFSVKHSTGDEVAPGSNPVQDTTPPLKTAEEKALAKVDATAPETPITTQTEPVAVPPLLTI